jgi:hypothetical protein
VDDLPRFVEALQSKGVVGKALVMIYLIRCKTGAGATTNRFLTVSREILTIFYTGFPKKLS